MRNVWPLAALCAGAMAVPASPPTRAAAADPSAIAGPITGDVEMLNPGASGWVPLAPGAPIPAGTQVRCMGGASAALELPGETSVLVAENTRYVLTAMASDPGSCHVLSHLVVGKVIARVREPVTARASSGLIISTPSGLVVVTGRGVVVAYTPALSRSVVAGLPAPGAGATESAAIWVPFATATAQVVDAGTLITHVAGQIPSAPVPISTLPPRAEQQLTAPTNSETAGSAILARESVIIVGPRTVHQVLSVSAAGLASRSAPTRREAAPTTRRELGQAEMVTEGSPCGSPRVRRRHARPCRWLARERLPRGPDEHARRLGT
jgi:hypothetical protein